MITRLRISIMSLWLMIACCCSQSTPAPAPKDAPSPRHQPTAGSVTNTTPPASSSKPTSARDLLNKKIEEKEAIIWYLTHSGWAIKTKSHLLIFDYWERDKSTTDPSLSRGHINATEIADHNVIVFVTHDHRDHYDQVIFDWKKAVPNIMFVIGWQAELGPNCISVAARENKQIGDLEISTIKSTDRGVGFLVRVDGLVIFHTGDHAYWGGSIDSFSEEILYLSKHMNQLDLAFLAIATGNGQRRESITKGALYAIEKLRPNIVFPMHGGGKEHLYREFIDDAAKQGFKTRMYNAVSSGDGFIYTNGHVVKVDSI